MNAETTPETEASTPSSEPYFERITAARFAPTEHVGGAWATNEQHIAPAIGLITHVAELDHASRHETPLTLARLSCDILGTLTLEPFELSVNVIRPGRTIELSEVRLAQNGRDAVIARAWFMQAYDTSGIAGSPLPRIAPPIELKRWDPSSVWPGGFIRSVEVRRAQLEPGSAAFWVRSNHPLLGGESVSAAARSLRLIDIANGMTTREPLKRAAFPNLDLTAHLFREPVGEWVGFNTGVTFGAAGVGLTSSVLHDELGPFGVSQQALTVRPK